MQSTRYAALRGAVVPVLSALLLLLGAPVAQAQGALAPEVTSSAAADGIAPTPDHTAPDHTAPDDPAPDDAAPEDAPAGATDVEHATMAASTAHRSPQPPRPDRTPLALVPLRVAPPVTSSLAPPVVSDGPGVADRHRSTADGRAPPA